MTAADGTPSAHDAGASAQALIGWLEERFGGSVRVVEAPSSKGEGFDSVIHLVHVVGAGLPDEWRRPLVLRIKSDAELLSDARREVDIHAWLDGRGYPAPRVLAVFAAGELLDRPVQVMERAPGVLMVDQVRARPWQTRRILRQLAELQVRLHRLPAEGFPSDDDLLDRRLRLTRQVAASSGDPELRAGLERVESFADELRAAPVSVGHGDFHPLNVLVADGRATVIDWTDAGLGDRHGDVARTIVLFETAAIAAANAAERAVLSAVGPLLGRVHRRSYEQWLPLDDDRLLRWRTVQLLHGWSQALSLVGGDGVDSADRLPSSGMAEDLRRRFHESLASLRP